MVFCLFVFCCVLFLIWQLSLEPGQALGTHLLFEGDCPSDRLVAEALRALTACRELGQNLAKDSGLPSLLFPYSEQRWHHLPSSHEAVSTLGLALYQQWLWGDRPMVVPRPSPFPCLIISRTVPRVSKGCCSVGCHKTGTPNTFLIPSSLLPPSESRQVTASVQERAAWQAGFVERWVS